MADAQREMSGESMEVNVFDDLMNKEFVLKKKSDEAQDNIKAAVKTLAEQVL